MVKLSHNLSADTLLDLDLFAAPVQLKFNSKSNYKTNVGGCFSIVYYIVCVFIVAAFFKSLIVGYDLNSVSTTYDLMLSESDFLTPTDPSPLGFKFGFQPTPSLLT